MSRGRTKYNFASVIDQTTELSAKRPSKLLDYDVSNEDIDTGSSSRKSIILSQRIVNGDSRKNNTLKTMSTRKSRFKLRTTTTTEVLTTVKVNIVTPSAVRKTKNFRSRSQATTASPSFATTSEKQIKNFTITRNSHRRPNKNLITTESPTITTRINRGRGAKEMSFLSKKHSESSDIESENYPEPFKSLLKSKKVDNIVVVTAQTTLKSTKFTTQKSPAFIPTTSLPPKKIERNRTSIRNKFQITTLPTSRTKDFFFPTRTTAKIETSSEEEHVWIDESPKYQKKDKPRPRSRLSPRPKSTRSTLIENLMKNNVDSNVSMNIL